MYYEQNSFTMFKLIHMINPRTSSNLIKLTSIAALSIAISACDFGNKKPNPTPVQKARSIYASGKTPYQLQEIALKLEESDIRDLTISRQGFVVGQKLQDYVNQHVGNKSIQDFPKRFAAVATELNTGKKAEFIKGNAGQAVRASCSIPNIFVPAEIGGKKYVDGGLVSPIPVSTAKSMGADIVIAVDISARPKNAKSMNLWGLLDQTINIMGQQSINNELQQADVVIQPAIGHLGVLDLEARNESILEGERAAQRQMPRIKKIIAEFKHSPQAFLAPPKAKF